MKPETILWLQIWLEIIITIELSIICILFMYGCLKTMQYLNLQHQLAVADCVNKTGCVV